MQSASHTIGSLNFDSRCSHTFTQIPERLMLTLELLKKELAVATLQQKLGKEVKYKHVLVHTLLGI